MSVLSFAPSSSGKIGTVYGSNEAAVVGYTAENPNTSISSVWYTPSSSALDSAYPYWGFDFSSIPSGATINSVTCSVNGKAESSTYSYQQKGKYCHYQIYKNGTAAANYTINQSTSNNTVTVDCGSSWTRAELDTLTLRNYVGYYGGNIRGITITVDYSAGPTPTTNKLYIKENGSWVEFSGNAYKKINGLWVLQSDLTQVFEEGVDYVRTEI